MVSYTLLITFFLISEMLKQRSKTETKYSGITGSWVSTVTKLKNPKDVCDEYYDLFTCTIH